MARTLRLLLVWLIMLTLPLQGVSASVMAMRMGGDPVQPAGTAHSTSAMQMADCHEMMMSASDARHDDHLGHSSPAPLKAKVCGSCCVGVLHGASLAPQVASLPAGNTYLTQLYHEPTGFIPDGLERPPCALS